MTHTTRPQRCAGGVGHENRKKDGWKEKEEVSEREKKGEGRRGGGGERGEIGHRPPARLTERDRAAVVWLAEQRAATVPQVARLLAQLSEAPVGEPRARQVVRRWEALGLTERRRVWDGEPGIVWPTKEGAALAGLARWRRPGISTLRHAVSVSEVRLRLAPVGAEWRWLAEGELRRAAQPGEHVADGAVVEGNGSSLAVEVELSPHGRRRVEGALTSLLSAVGDGGRPRWQRVLYLCSADTLAQVSAVIAELPPHWRARVQARRLP